ncbi:hypothetical protein LCGC14_2146710, partial [marine sediment metagenome]
MNYEPIVKPPPERMPVTPNLIGYEAVGDAFRWDDIRAELDGLPGGGLNIAYECIDRHLTTDRKDKVAMLWEAKDGRAEAYTFAQMAAGSNKAANALRSLGVEKGDRVFVFLERVPELYFTVFGTLKLGAVIGPLFSAFGPDAVRDRLADSEAKVLLTSPDLWARVKDIRADLPRLQHVVILDRRGGGDVPEGTVAWPDVFDAQSEEFEIEATDPEDFAIMHYTSGTTGKPKGAAHVHMAVMGHYATAKYVLDLHDDDVYWCTADPGWVTGTSYGMFGPWSNGATSLVYEGGFGVGRWYSLIEKYRVSVWYTAPTAIRMLMKAGEELPRKHDLSSLRYVCSVGEPLNPEGVLWGQKAFGLPIHDNWWQTETGSILIANYLAMDIRPGSMGRSFPGIEPAIIDDDGNELPPGEEGDLAVQVANLRKAGSICYAAWEG